jgi:methionyl-tRNA synthetase
MLSKLKYLNLINKSTFFLSINRFQSTRSTVNRDLILSSLGNKVDKSPYFISTPIYYVNGNPHIGHAYTSVTADVLARFQRCNGREVMFVTGTDEHGQKVEQSALATGQTPIKFTSDISAKFRHLVDNLGCSHDDFIRTTEERHAKTVNDLWKRLEDNGQIYLGSYEGWYSIRDEAFYTDSELIDGKAPTGATVEWVKEESYFFRLSEYTDKLLEFYSNNPEFIAPKSRRNEVIGFVNQDGGLKDISISRMTFSWGIPVPGDPKHVVYVWLDALANYLTSLGFVENKDNFDKFWSSSIHIVGKDILRFHGIYWPAFLMGAGIKPPSRVFSHGWWTKNGEKMSKSVGNVVDPFKLIDIYGKDYLRYYFVSEVNFGNDADFSHESIHNKINSDLANDLGNLVQRITTLIYKNCDGKIPYPNEFTAEDQALLQSSVDLLDITREAASTQNLKAMSESIINVSKSGNRYIDRQAPWVLLKSDVPRMHTVLYVLMESIRRIAILLSPIMPDSCSRLLDQTGVPLEMRTFESILVETIEPGSVIGIPTPIFPKLELYIDNPTPIIENSIYNIDLIGKDMDIEQLSFKISELGNEIRRLKLEKAEKKIIKVNVDLLLKHKEIFNNMNKTAVDQSN